MDPDGYNIDDMLEVRCWDCIQAEPCVHGVAVGSSRLWTPPFEFFEGGLVPVIRCSLYPALLQICHCQSRYGPRRIASPFELRVTRLLCVLLLLLFELV